MKKPQEESGLLCLPWFIFVSLLLLGILVPSQSAPELPHLDCLTSFSFTELGSRCWSQFILYERKRERIIFSWSVLRSAVSCLRLVFAVQQWIAISVPDFEQGSGWGGALKEISGGDELCARASIRGETPKLVLGNRFCDQSLARKILLGLFKGAPQPTLLYGTQMTDGALATRGKGKVFFQTRRKEAQK